MKIRDKVIADFRRVFASLEKRLGIEKDMPDIEVGDFQDSHVSQEGDIVVVPFDEINNGSLYARLAAESIRKQSLEHKKWNTHRETLTFFGTLGEMLARSDHSLDDLFSTDLPNLSNEQNYRAKIDEQVAVINQYRSDLNYINLLTRWSVKYRTALKEYIGAVRDVAKRYRKGEDASELARSLTVASQKLQIPVPTWFAYREFAKDGKAESDLLVESVEYVNGSMVDCLCKTPSQFRYEIKQHLDELEGLYESTVILAKSLLSLYKKTNKQRSNVENDNFISRRGELAAHLFASQSDYQDNLPGLFTLAPNDVHKGFVEPAWKGPFVSIAAEVDLKSITKEPTKNAYVDAGN